MRQKSFFFQTSSVNLEPREPSCEGWDRPRTSGRRGGTFSGGGANVEKGPCSVTGVLAGLGRRTGTPLSRVDDVPTGGMVGLPGPP